MTAHVDLLSPFVAYLLIAVGMTLALVINGVIGLFVFKSPRALVTSDTLLPSISVLVPARDEERVIERCVRSLLAQNYPDFEVVVLDDNSSDATYDILCKLRDQDHRLRVLAGASLPGGWCGKPFACWQLANAARNECLLLTDADCEFAPDALLLAVGAHAEHKADVISLSPDYVAVTFWEQLLIPLLVVIPIAFLPIYMVRGSRLPVFAAANGAFIFLSRRTYFDVDGHRAVRGQLAEDVKFAQHVKRMGKTLWYGDGRRVYRVRMYESLQDIWRGFTRNLFPAFSGKLGILAATLAYLTVVFILPPVLALAGYALGAPWTLLALAPYILIVALRLGIALALRRDTLLSAVLNPLAWSITLAIAVASVVKNRKTGAEWKGRVYVEGEASER